MQFFRRVVWSGDDGVPYENVSCSRVLNLLERLMTESDKENNCGNLAEII